MVHLHSVAEAYAYLMVTPCPTCGRGRLREQGELRMTEAASGEWTLDSICESCKGTNSFHFSINPPPTRESAASTVINPTTERSRAIDLLGWLGLYRSILSSLSKGGNAQQARELALEAAQCLDEALKFYDADNDLPPPEAFFTVADRRRLRDHPEQFARSRWLAERRKLPEMRVRTQEAKKGLARRLWQIWRRRN